LFGLYKQPPDPLEEGDDQSDQEDHYQDARVGEEEDTQEIG
jgi:hypothetical protein